LKWSVIRSWDRLLFILRPQNLATTAGKCRAEWTM
jgi:hypothetical protein